MSIYTKFVTYNKLISPITGYETGRVTKTNIKNFGFESIEDLHEKYPGFPTNSDSYLDKKRYSLEQRELEKRGKYLNNPNICNFCKGVISYEKRKCSFCSQSCANTFTNLQKGPRSKKTKIKISDSLKLYNIENTDKVKKKSKRKPKEKIPSICVICGNAHFKSSKAKTCSKNCLSQLQSINSLNQESHGGGKKGRYKNIYCDSSWELAFLIFHLDHGNNIKRCTEKRTYVKNGAIKNYQPDFVVDGITFEIKGYMSETAKLKLLYNKDIKVIAKEEIYNYIKYVKKKYNVSKIEMLYDEKDYKEHLKCCKNCKTIFETGRKNAVFCSRQCSARYPKSKEHKKKISEKVSKNWKEKKNNL